MYIVRVGGAGRLLARGARRRRRSHVGARRRAAAGDQSPAGRQRVLRGRGVGDGGGRATPAAVERCRHVRGARQRRPGSPLLAECAHRAPRDRHQDRLRSTALPPRLRPATGR